MHHHPAVHDASVELILAKSRVLHEPALHGCVMWRTPLVQGFPWPQESALACVHVQSSEDMPPTNSIINRAEAAVAAANVKRSINAQGVGPREVGAITPYDVHTRHVKEWLRAAG